MIRRLQFADTLDERDNWLVVRYVLIYIDALLSHSEDSAGRAVRVLHEEAGSLGLLFLEKGLHAQGSTNQVDQGRSLG